MGVYTYSSWALISIVPSTLESRSVCALLLRPEIDFRLRPEIDSFCAQKNFYAPRP